MQRFITIICVAFMFVGIAGGSMADSISDALVVEGRALLFNNGDPTYQGIIDANAKFEQANTADDEDQKAMLFLAVTKLAVFGLENGDNPAMLQTFRDLYEAFGVSRTDAESLLDSPISEPPTVFDEYDPPETMPNGDELQTFLAGPFFDLIIEVIGYVDGVTDQAIMINVTAEELGDVTGVEVDYGDVLLLRSSLYTLKAFILFMDSYDMDALDIQEFSVLINADVIQLQRDIFARYGDFLKLKPTNSLAASKTALLTAIDTWQAAYDFIVAEGEPQEDDLFAFGSEEEIDDAEDTLAQMADFRTSLADNVPMEIETREIKWVLTNIDNGTKLGFWVEIEDGEVGEGHAWGIDNCEFLFCSGGVDEYSINGDQITIQLETYQWCEDHEEILSATLTGTLNETHDQIISGTYSKPGCSGQSTGPFDFTGELIEDETEVVKMDFNLIFGNTGKLAIDIHDALPEFDVYDEPTPGSFPEPVLGGFFPDISTNGDATMFFELQPSGPFVIPTRTVTFTGNMADWLSNELLHDDIEGDNDTEIIGADIENVYLAKDATYLYVGMTLYDGVPNQAVVYGVGFRNWADDGYMPLKIYAAYNPGFLTWFAGLNQWDSDVFTDPTGVFVGTNCIEWKIPLIEITTRLDNNSLSGKFVSTATLLVENGEELDVNETRIQLDPATLTGDFTCPAYDGTGKIFIKVMGEADPNSDWDLGSIWVDGSSGTYTIGGLPAGQDVYVYAFWDKDDNGVVTYPDLWWGTADDSPFTIQAGTNTLNIDITNPFDPFVVDGRIIYVHESDDSFKTYYIVDVSNFKLGDLPDGVTAVTVKDPAGNVLLTMGDLEFYGEWNEFFIAVDGEPQLGTYEFSVTAGGITITVTDTQDANTVVPVPDTGSLVPADGAVVDSMTPVFSWDAVDFKNAFYRLQIIDQLGNWVYATSRVPGMLWAVVPQNILQPGQTYSWRIRVIDSDNWLDVQNRANSDWISFTMAGTSNNGAPPPVNFVMDGAIIHYYTADGSSKTWYDLYIHDYPETVSLPDDVESLIITGPDGVVVDGKDQIPYEGGGDFFTEVNGPPQIGTYTFSVTIGGTTKTYADVQVVNRFIPTPEATQFSVESDAVINVKTPTFTWDPVSVDGVQLYYRLQIRDADGQYVHTTPRTLGMTSYTLPEGVLNPDTQYQYRVRVSDADDWLYVQNRAHSGWQDFSTAASLGDVATAFKMEANVLNYTASGGSQKTWYDLYLYEYSGTAALPDAVTALTITGPGGGVVVSTKGEMEYTVYGAAEGDFFTEVSGRPLTGTYTFSVTIGGITKTYADVQIVNHAIPTPDATQFSVQSDAVIDVKTPTFTWNPVSLAGVPLYYRLQIQDAGGQDVHTTPRTLGMTSYTLPEGVLTPGSSYQYRVRVSDADNWLYVQNRAHSGWQGFSTDISLGDSASAFQIEGNVLNYTAADGSQKTWYDLYLYDYSGTAALPDAVTGGNGIYRLWCR